MAVITISREPGAHGEEIAARVAGRLGFLLIDKARLAQTLGELDLNEGGAQGPPADARERMVSEQAAGSPEEAGVASGKDADAPEADDIVPAEDETDPEIVKRLRLVPDLMRRLAEENDMVIIERGSQGLFRDRPGVLHVRVVASRSFRIAQIKAHEGLSAREAGRRIREQERNRARYLRSRYQLNWADPCLYDLTLRMDRLSIDQAIQLVLAAAEETKLLETPRKLIVEGLSPGGGVRKSAGRFVNEAEEEFARFLEYYRIAYEYEPRTFPLEYDGKGKVKEAFTPDFYLPDQDLYIELTTMKQSLVTRKNRKVKKLRRLYPDINIRIFYQHDFYSLLAKYDMLSGEHGKTDKIPEP